MTSRPRSIRFNGGGIITELYHRNKEDREWIKMLLGLIFADPTLRRLFGRPMSSDDRYTWLVWNNEDRVYGFAALKLDRPGAGAELCHAYTDPAWRGKGFHSYSVARRIDIAKEIGASHVYTVLRPKGEAYYAERGFIRTGQRGQYLILSKDLRTPVDEPEE